VARSSITTCHAEVAKGGKGTGGTRQGLKATREEAGRLKMTSLTKYEKKNNSVDFADVTGKMKELATDQNGSRYIQYFFETASWEQKSLIFSELISATNNLTMDPFGN